MKKLIISMLIAISATILFAQSPHAFKYQAVARDNAGQIIPNQEVIFRISIHDGSVGGTILYQETQLITTNQFGLANLEIGTVTPVIGTFSGIDWGNDMKFLEVEIDPNGGSSYVSMGTTQLLSVPYSLFSERTESAAFIKDQDGDTYITTEHYPDDDTIRMFIAGVEKLKITDRSIEPANTGNSIFIGKNAGKNEYMLGYENVFIGYNSGSSNTSGYRNTAVGTYSLQDNTTGSYNTSIGVQSLYQNTTGHHNTSTGFQSLYNNTTGENNTSIGAMSLYQNTTGLNNTAVGNSSLIYNTEGDNNTSIGHTALQFNTTGYCNTSVGTYSIRGNTTGNQNTAIGYFSMYGNSKGSFNTAVGASALYVNSTGNNNIAVGPKALAMNTTGNSNVAIGNNTLYSNTIESNLVAIGDSALFSNESFGNTAIGAKALQNNTIGYMNTAVGYYALNANISSNGNSAFGLLALASNSAGYYNTAVGSYSLSSNVSGGANTAVGYSSLDNNSVGFHNVGIGNGALYLNNANDNTAIGYYSLALNTSGVNNSSTGSESLHENTTGFNNTANGYRSMYFNTTGNKNTGIGYYSLYYNITGTSNTGCGYTAGPANGSSNLTNATALGNLATNTASNQVRIGSTAVTSIGGYVGWSNLSDKRFKINILENVPGLEFISKLRPVTYQLNITKLDEYLGYSAKDPDYQNDGEKANAVHSGFIAQEVEEAAQSIGYNFSGIDPAQNEGDHYGLRYAEFVVPLVKAVQELARENEDLKVRIEKLESK